MNNQQIDTIKKWLGTGSINVFGRPFAGKDTQGERLAELLEGQLIGGGDILRHYPDQEQLKELLSTGELIPTEIFFKIVLPYLSQDKLKNKPFILSSVGRLAGEESTILDATEHSGHKIKAVIYLELSEDEVRERFNVSAKNNDRGERSDDNQEALEIRLREFREKTQPVIDFYDKNDLLVRIDGTKTRDEVTEEILARLTELAEGAPSR